MIRGPVSPTSSHWGRSAPWEGWRRCLEPGDWPACARIMSLQGGTRGWATSPHREANAGVAPLRSRSRNEWVFCFPSCCCCSPPARAATRSPRPRRRVDHARCDDARTQGAACRPGPAASSPSFPASPKPSSRSARASASSAAPSTTATRSLAAVAAHRAGPEPEHRGDDRARTPTSWWCGPATSGATSGASWRRRAFPSSRLEVQDTTDAFAWSA